MSVQSAERVHHETQQLTLEILAKRPAADGVVEVVLGSPDGAELPAWLPGAHLDLHLADGLDRQYSLCGSPGDRGTYRLGVLREPAGRGGSQFVHEGLAPGQSVEVTGPNNHFELVSSPRYRFIAGGIGITPLMPMLETAEREGAEWSLTYMGRSRATMAFLDEIVARHPGKVEVCPNDEVGILDLVERFGTVQEDTLVYACGPEGMLRAMESATAHWPAGSLHLERFAPKDAELLTKDRGTFTVRFTESDVEVEVPEDRSIVEVAEEAGVPVIFSCMEGTCGTCETRVLCGEIDHRDSILSDEEKAENDVMMICVSRAKGDRLELEI